VTALDLTEIDRDDVASDPVLDNPAWSALTGAHAHLAEGDGLARRYPSTVSPFAAIADEADPRAWSDLAALVGPGCLAVLTGRRQPAPEGWTVLEGGNGVQMVGDLVRGAASDDVVVLDASDVPEMLDLVERTKPGPFEPRTIELGGYLGVRRDRRLVAMAGRRLNPTGWTEISAVCTDEAHRGHGFASRLVLAVAAGIRADGDLPLLHAAGNNLTAISVYERLGFRLVRRPRFELLRAPS
jgi:ribosomal protein S18 acetylase RimI-like enzyme